MKFKEFHETLQTAENEQFTIAQSFENGTGKICATTISTFITLTVVGLLFKTADSLRQSSHPGAAAWLSILGVVALIALTAGLTMQAKEVFCPKPQQQPNSPRSVPV